MLFSRPARGAPALAALTTALTAALTAVLAGCASPPPGTPPASPPSASVPVSAPANPAASPAPDTPQAAAPLPWCVQTPLREEDDLMRNFGGIPAGVRKIEETRFIASYDRSTGKVGPLDNGNRFVMEFDAQGHLLASTDRGRYTYDADGRLHSINGASVDWESPGAWVVHAMRHPAWKEQVRQEDGRLEWTRSIVPNPGNLHHRRPGTVQTRQFDDECFALSRQWEAPNEARQVVTADGRVRPAPKMVSYRTFASVERKPDGSRIVRENGAAAFIDGQWLPLAWDNEVSEYSPRHELLRVTRTDAATGEHHVSEYHYKYDDHGNIVRIVITSPAGKSGEKIDPFANVFVRKLTYFDATAAAPSADKLTSAK
ncbi:RHS repeat domain-containing protein [Pandoraea faecigallinarum]|uniref:RHS repeat domain-containing protein n=1 Tax=Pandoraea faecigallinarum TaxID=656179 RepID=UPI000A44ED15|nr:RHS repeat domain-containing protein [Pandoraea faecigallinarum]